MLKIALKIVLEIKKKINFILKVVQLFIHNSLK